MGNLQNRVSFKLNKTSATFLILFCSILISFNGLAVRNINHADALLINLYRSIALMSSVSIFLLITTKKPLFRHISAIGWPGIFGGVLMGCANICFLQALTNTTVANALFTISAIPFITALLAFVFLREKLSLITILTMTFASIGVTIMFSSGLESGQMYGNIMALLTALVFSGFAIIVRKYRSIDMIPTLLLAGFISGIIGLIASFDNLIISFHDLFLCFLLGGVLSGVANCGFIIATRYLVAAEVTLYMFVEFALGPIWVWYFANENISATSLIGGAIIMLSVATRSIYQLKNTKS